MEVLHYEENQFRYKLANIFFQYAKCSVSLAVFAYYAQSFVATIEVGTCAVGQASFVNIVLI